MASDEYEQFPLDPGSYIIGELPYFLKVQKIQENIYFAEGICNRMTYRVWRSRLYASGFPETMIREPRRHLETSELEQVGRYF